MKNDYPETDNEECDKEIIDYRNKIIEDICKIENKKVLCFIYDLVNSFKEKWGI